MLLLTMSEWFGPSQHRDRSLPSIEPSVRTVAFVTRLPLSVALERIRHYEAAYKRRNRGVTSVEFSLLGVDTIDDLDEATIDLARVQLVEALAVDGNELVNPAAETQEPEIILNIRPGRDVHVMKPPLVQDLAPYTETVLRSIATGVGISYEDLTSDHERPDCDERGSLGAKQKPRKTASE